jgi:hypothetical protein
MTAQVVARAFIGRLTGWDGGCPADWTRALRVRLERLAAQGLILSSASLSREARIPFSEAWR